MKKILGILIMTLLIAGAFIPLVNSLNVVNNSNGDWIEQAKLLASDGATDDFFGYSVSIDGDYALIGAYNDDGQSGSAYVFKRTITTWTQQAKLTASDGTVYFFGNSVSIDGDYALIGAYGDDDNGGYSGSAYIFKRSGTTWTQQAKLTASDGTTQDRFGFSVSINGDYALIGAFKDDDNGQDSGSAYIFKRSGTTWTQQQKLTASDGTTQDHFGGAVSIDGDYALIGTDWDYGTELNPEAAYVFKRSGTTWTQQQKLTASDVVISDSFGCHVSIQGEYALIGAFKDDDNGQDSGSAYIFKRSGTTWTQQAKLTASDGTTQDHFGRSVSIDENYAIIGSDWDDPQGSAYIFKRSGTTWTQQQKLTASDGTSPGPWFGGYVSIDGDYALIGRCGDSENGETSGSAYVFMNNENNPPNTPSPLSGPSTGKVGDTLEFTTSTTDPDDDNIYYGLEEDGDNTADWWTTNSYPSGYTVTISITFNSEGTYNFRVRAKDTNDALSGFSTLKTVTISSNNEPDQPDTLSGPTSGTIGESYSYSTSATDPDGDQIKYGFDWDGNGIVDDWSKLYNSGSSCQMSHSWDIPGTYNIKVKAKDDENAESIWSPTLTVVISGENNPPNTPSTSYNKADDELIITATDPDNDQVKYGISWENDGIIDQWTELVESGTEKRIDCGGRKGKVGVIAEDEHGAQSSWVSQTPKNKAINILTMIQQFIQKYPVIYHLYQFIRFL